MQIDIPDQYIDCVHNLHLDPRAEEILFGLIVYHKVRYKTPETRLFRYVGHPVDFSQLVSILSSNNFPLRTKVYVTGHLQLGKLNLPVSQCHELIDILYQQDFAGYHGDAVDLIVIYLENEPLKLFRNSIDILLSTISVATSILILGQSDRQSSIMTVN